jgi:O-antigen ligase
MRRELFHGNSSLSALAARSRIAPSTVAVVAFAIAVEVGLAVISAEPQYDRYVQLAIAAGVAAFALRLPLFTTTVLLVLVASIFHRNYFQTFGYGSVSLHLHEALVFLLFALAVVRPKRRTWGGPVGLALAAFLGAVLLAMLFSVSADRATLYNAIDWSRPFVMLLLFYVVVRLFPDREAAQRLLGAAAVVVVITGVAALILAAGSWLDSTLQDPANTQIRSESALSLGSLNRIRLPGIALTYTLFWYTLVQLIVRDSRRLGWGIAFAACVVTEALTFNRNMWIGLLCTMILMALLLTPQVRHRLVVGLLVIATSIVVLAAVAPGLGSESRVQPLVKRGSTLFKPDKVSEESSVTEREQETHRAWANAQDHLGIGVGPGAPFGVFHLQNVSYKGGTGLRVPQLYLHNQYLYLLVIGGLPVIGAFLLFIGLALRRAWRLAPRDPSLIALGCGLVAILISGVVEIYFTTDHWTTTIGLVTGAIVAMSWESERPRRRVRGVPPAAVRELPPPRVPVA